MFYFKIDPKQILIKNIIKNAKFPMMFVNVLVDKITEK